jgi:hypothetical protein
VSATEGVALIDCGRIVLQTPIVLSDDTFVAGGEYIGPEPPGQENRRARLEGVLRGRHIEVRITVMEYLSPAFFAPGPFVATENVEPHVAYCR